MTHAIKTIPQDRNQKLSKCVDRTIVEKRTNPANQMLLDKSNILSQKEIEELSEIAFGTMPQVAQATQQWEVQNQGAASQSGEDQKDLLDYLRLEQAESEQGMVKMQQ